MITTEQREARKNSIGGSDAAAVAGLSKWRTPHDVWREKYLKINKEFTDSQLELMGWGNRLENVILDKYEEKTGLKITRNNETFQHSKYNFLTGNIDGFCEKTGAVIEVKTAQRKDGWGQPGTDNIPDDYLCQVAHYCLILDAKCAHIAVLFNGNDFKLYKYERNKELEALLLDKSVSFWNNNIINGVEPEAKTITDVKHKYKMAQDESKIATNFSYQNHLKLKELKNKEEELKKEIDALILEQKKYMGHASQLTDDVGNVICTWRQHERETFDKNHIKKNYPDIYSAAISKKPYRSFLIK